MARVAFRPRHFADRFQNRFIVLSEWFWAYLTRERSARLITGDARIARCFEISRSQTDDRKRARKTDQRKSKKNRKHMSK